jgi:hypothetical protein
MCKRVGVAGAVGCLISAMVFGNACAQQPGTRTGGMPTAPQIRTIALKSGETVELGPVFSAINCKSIVIGEPQAEIMEGPPELTLTVRPGIVVPRAQGCVNQIPGGTLVATAKEIPEKKSARLVYRVKFKTKDGDRQAAGTYFVELFP